MPIDNAHIDALARHVHERYERKARRDQDWNNGMAVAEAAARAIGGALTDLSQRMDPDEVAVDLAHVERYKVGVGGVRLTLTMLVATNRHFWHLVHSDGAVVTAVPFPMAGVTTEKKSLSASIEVDRSGTGWRIRGPKALVAWVDDIARTQPQAPVGLLAKVAASSPVPLASWLADPTGRHQLRYWDGRSWTEHVSDRGATMQDPLG